VSVGVVKEKVLVVDDDAWTRETIREFLVPRFEVLEAGEATQGLKLAASACPAIILVDLCLPGMDGLTLCRELRGGAVTHLIPIIVVTGLSDVGNRRDALSAGANDFLSKPFRRDELLARIQTQLNNPVLTNRQVPSR
jgi:DNA-binding response OmpR family regulator